LATQEAKETQVRDTAERQTEALDQARRRASARAETFRRREMLVRAQVDALERQARRLEDDADTLAMERDVLVKETESLKDDLARARSRTGAAVLPYKGANGTWRLPISIECHNGCVTLQPNGPTISLVDLSPILSLRNNPLVLAVAKEMMELQTIGTPDGEAAVPYILFVIRPDGIRPYYEARARLELLGLSFGYELVAQDEDIEFPDLTKLSEWSGTPAPRRMASARPEPAWTRPRRGSEGGEEQNKSQEYVWQAKSAAVPDGGGSLERGDVRGTGSGELLEPPAELTGLPGARRLGDASPTGSGLGTDGSTTTGGAAIRNAPPSQGVGPARGTPPYQGGGPGQDVSSRFDRGAGSSSSHAFPRTDSPPTPHLDGGGFGGVRTSDVEVRNGPVGDRKVADGSDQEGLGDVRSSDPADPSDASSPGHSVALLNTQPSGRGLGGRPDLSSRFPADTNSATSSAPSLGDWPSGGNPAPLSGRTVTGQASGSTPRSASPNSGLVLGASDGSTTAPDPGKIGLGLPGMGAEASSTKGENSQGTGPHGATVADNEIYRKQKTLPIVVTCDAQGVKIQPGGYRLTLAHLEPKEGRLPETLRGVVAQRQAASPKVDLKPHLKFLVEPGGETAYWKARQQTFFSGLGWPIELRVAERDPLRLGGPEEPH
jgi:hypothetical protein